METSEANTLEPFAPTHPGEVLKDEIECRGLSQKALADCIGVSYSQLNEVLNGKRPLNTEIALLIGTALNIDAAPLLVMQTRYDIVSAKRSASLSKRLETVRQLAAML